MNAIDQQCWKFSQEYKKAKASGKSFNFREVAGKFLSEFELNEAAEAASKALSSSPDPVLEEAVALLKKLIERRAIDVSFSTFAGSSQVSNPAPAAAQGGAKL